MGKVGHPASISLGKSGKRGLSASGRFLLDVAQAAQNIVRDRASIARIPDLFKKPIGHLPEFGDLLGRPDTGTLGLGQSFLHRAFQAITFCCGSGLGIFDALSFRNSASILGGVMALPGDEAEDRYTDQDVADHGGSECGEDVHHRPLFAPER